MEALLTGVLRMSGGKQSVKICYLGKIDEPKMFTISFNNLFRDRMGEVERGHAEVYPKLWNLRLCDRTNGEIFRISKLLRAYQKLRKKTEDWKEFKRLPSEIPEYPPIGRMLIGAESVVQTPRTRASGVMKGEWPFSQCRWIRVYATYTVCVF